MALTTAVSHNTSHLPLQPGLECLVGRVSLVLPIETVVQIVEYRVTPPPPLASPWFSGFGLHAGRVVISMSLFPSSASARVTTAVLLRVPGHDGTVAFEVTAATAIVKAILVPRDRGLSPTGFPFWILHATTDDGRSLGWVDAVALIDELMSSAR